MHVEASRLIGTLGLEPHPEGGWYRETFRSEQRIVTADGRARTAATSIYFLLTSGEFSAFHRIASEETWHFYRGSAVRIEMIAPGGEYECRRIGTGDDLQTTIPANTWFASHVESPQSYALVGCDVAPGFDFADFELAERSELTRSFPTLAPLVTSFTRLGNRQTP